MPKIIEMPKLSDTMTEGTLAKWSIAEGDTVTGGQSIADVETDKATMEMQSFFDGKVLKLLVQAGDKVPLSAPMAIVLEEGEEAPADVDAFVAEAKAKASADSAAEDSKKSSGSGDSTKSSKGIPGLNLPIAPQHRRRAAASKNGVRVKASPLARKIAEERGVDLTTLTGTGPGGRIVRDDVESAPVGGSGGGRVSSVPTIRPVAGPDDERVATSNMRNIIAERLLASKTQIPHFYLQVEVDAAPMMQFRKNLNTTSEKTGGNKYTVNDFILKAVIRGAETVKEINAAWDGDAIVKYKHVGLSIAIAIDDGLVTPVIKKADTKTLLEISTEVKDLAGRAKNKKLSPAEFEGGTITVSNLGAYGVDQFSAIVNPPQAAILAVGSIRNTPVVNDKGEIVVGQRMWLGLSGDHRVVDGAVGATFIAEVKKLLESPALMLV